MSSALGMQRQSPATPTRQSSERLHEVEWMRGGAAVMVAWFHLTATHGGTVGLSGSLGWLGVDCFFVISGFVIPLSMHRIGYTIDLFPAFLARRLVRLEPPYLISIALVVALQIASGLAPGFRGESPNCAPAQLALHVFYLIPFSTFPWISPVYWSLAYEFAFYVLAGLLFPVFWRRPAVLTVIVVCGASLLTEPGGADPPRIPLFLMGIAAARRHIGYDSVCSFGLGLACAIAAMAVGQGVLGDGPTVDVGLSACVGCATALVAAGATAEGTGLPAPWLGRISYALYLTHVPVGGRVVNLGRRFVEGPVQECLLSLVALAVCLVFAELFRRLFEKPFVRLSRRISLRHEASDTRSMSGGGR